MRFFDRKISARITSLIIIGLIISFAGVVGLQIQSERQRILDTFKQGQRNVTLLLAENILPAVRFGRAKVIEKHLDGLINAPDSLMTHIEVFDSSGAPLLTYDRAGDNNSAQTDINIANWLKFTPTLQVSDLRKEIGFLAPVQKGNQVIGALLVYWDKEPILSQIRTFLVRQVAISIFFILIVSFGLLVLMNRSVTFPISSLTSIMNRMSHGDFEQNIPYAERRDEVGDIAKAVEVFRQNGIELDKLRASLESEVALKTSELRVAKEKAEATSHELAMSQERYDLAVRGASVGIWDLDVKGKKLYWSDHLKHTLGIHDPSFQPNADAFEERVHEEDRALIQSIFANQVKNGNHFDCECRLLSDDGDYVDVRVRGEPVMNEQGHVSRVAGSLEDISNQKATQAALREKQKREALGDLASGVAHEINNLLQLPAMANDIIIPHIDPENDKIINYVERTSQSAQKARTIVDDILKFSRGMDMQHDKEALPFNEVVASSMEFIHNLFPSSLRFEINGLDETRDLVQVNQTEISQVITNLVNNAAHAMGTKGTITLSARRTELNEAEAKSMDANIGSYCILSITDTGHGMSQGTIDRIFNPLFTTKPVGEGTGLGLSVVLGIIHSYHGHIQVESTEGKGSTFSIYLPVYS